MAATKGMIHVHLYVSLDRVGFCVVSHFPCHLPDLLLHVGIVFHAFTTVTVLQRSDHVTGFCDQSLCTYERGRITQTNNNTNTKEEKDVTAAVIAQNPG